MKTLTREGIQRMVDGGTGGIGGGGVDASMLAGFATQSWVEDNYISISFFSRLFKAYAGTGSSAVEVLPNDTESTIDNIKAMFGFWTEQYVSALGQGSGGGGVTLNEPLASINTAGLGTPSQSGVAIMWNGTAWTYQVPGGGGGGGGTVTSVGMSVPTGFAVSGSPVTGSGTLALSFATGYSLPMTTDVNKGVTAYGWGDHAQAGYALASNVYSKTDADQKFMTIAAFENLFNAIGSDGTTKINHPYASGVASIKAMVGLWTEQYLSALGQNGGGGGVTLNEPLASINSASLGTPTQSGQVITWNGSQWIYAIPSGGGGGGTGTVTSITAGTGLSGGTITTMGTIAIDSTYQTYISNGQTAYGWGNHADAGYLKSISSSAVTTALGYTPLSNSTSFWGQTVSSGVVNGSIEAGNSGGAISGFHSIELNSHGTLSGYGGFIDFHYNGSSADYTTRLIEDASGVLTLSAMTMVSSVETIVAAGFKVGSRNGSYIEIGDIRIVYDNATTNGNNALKIVKSDGTAANLYATGGVSALGVMATDSGMLENLNLTGRLKFIDVENEYEHQIYGDTDGYLHINASEGIELNSDLNLNGYTLYMTGGNIDANYVSGKRFYLDGYRYLYLDTNNVLKYYDNGTVRTIAFA